MRSRHALSLSFLLLLAACATAPQQPPAAQVAARWLQQVTAISAGDDTAARGAAITDRLRALGLPAQQQAFQSGALAGHNLVADLGGPVGAPLLLIGAHYDRVDVGRGATDNASGAAAVLELAAALRKRPLRNVRVKVAFWDLEERGLLGSRAWIAAPAQERPALYVNFDVFGWGDTLWLMTPQADGPLAAATRDAAGANGLPLRAGAEYPPTDHRAFLDAGLPAVSFSLLGAAEIDPTLQVYAGQKLAQLPKVAQVIHSDRDRVAELDATAVPLALRTIEAALRTWDAR
ncbi:MAG: M20/M25/M40 family metallo-hydrolase [Steroidobacteraceae bacterium]